MTTCGLSRRSVLAAAALLPFSRLASAQDGRVVATAFPGSYEEAARRLPAVAFEKATGAQALIQPVLAQEAMGRVLAAKGGKPPYDVVILDEATYLNSLKDDVFEKIDPAKVPNLPDIATGFGDERGVGVFVAAHVIGIAYNPTTVKEAPTSWQDLWNPAFKGRVGITNLNSGLGTAFLAEINRLRGGRADNFDAGFAALKELLPNISAIAANPGALATLFQQGEIDVAFNFLSAVEPLRQRGVDIAFARPKEGYILLRNSMHVIKGTLVPDLALAYLDANLDPEVQAAMGQNPYVVFPTNRKVAFGPDLAPYAKDQDDLVKNNVLTDWTAINPQRPALIERFNREINQ
jgi:putative spermidine/putrescine transport system substrate-binding protein